MLIEDDGGFVSFFPSESPSCYPMDLGLEEEEEGVIVEEPIEESLQGLENVIRVDFKNKRRDPK